MKCTSKMIKAFGLLFLLCMFPLWTYAQNVTVKGTVSDEGGPLIGATVKVKGATSGAVTDMDGNYSIQASPKQTLVFSYLGYETKEIYVGSCQSAKRLNQKNTFFAGSLQFQVFPCHHFCTLFQTGL